MVLRTPPSRKESTTLSDEQVCSKCKEQTKIIINELCAFIVNKSDTLPENAIVQICSSAYNLDEIEDGRRVLFSHLAPHKKILRKKEGSEQKSILEMIKLVKEFEPNLPIFVAKNLNKLPPVSFDHIDVTTFLKDMTLLRKEIADVKVKQLDDNLHQPSPGIEALKCEIEGMKIILQELQSRKCFVEPPLLPHIDKDTSRQHNDGFAQPVTSSLPSEVQEPGAQCPATTGSVTVSPVAVVPVTVCPADANPDTGGNSELKHDRKNQNKEEAVAQDPGTQCPAATGSVTTKNKNKKRSKVSTTPRQPTSPRTTMNMTYVSLPTTVKPVSFADKVKTAYHERPAQQQHSGDEQWTLVRGKNRKRITNRRGTGEPLPQFNFRAAERMMSLYLSRVCPESKTSDISGFIKYKTGLDVKATKLNAYDNEDNEFNAFKVRVPVANVDTFLNRQGDRFWPKDIVFRRFLETTRKPQNGKVSERLDA